MRRRYVGSVLLACSVLVACAGEPGVPPGMAPPPPLGATLSGHFAIGNRIIPLPPGTWRVTHAGVDHGWTNSGAGGIQTNLERSVLVQEAEGRAVGLVVVATAREVGVLWRPFGACVGPTLRRRVVGGVEGNVDCQEVAVYTSPGSTNALPYLATLAEEATRRAGWLPDRWIGVGYSISRGGNMLDVTYRFSAAMIAPTARTMSNGGPFTPGQLAVVDRMAGWMERERDAVQAGFRGQPPARPMSAP